MSADAAPAWAELTQRVRNADGAAENEIADFFHPRIVAMATVRLRDRETAREIAQETMIGVLQALRNGAVRDAGNLPGLVAGTARNLINNHVRRELRKREFVALFPEAEPVPASVPETQEKRSRLGAALSVLNAKDRKILLLTLGAMNPREIGRLLRLKVENVRTRKSRAVKAVIGEMARLSRSVDLTRFAAQFDSPTVLTIRAAFSNPAGLT